MNEAQRIKSALPAIITWYAENRRVLPWREDPTPYHIWISEIMLQQTRIEAVIPYYTRFLQELPDVTALAAVPEEPGKGDLAGRGHRRNRPVAAVHARGRELRAAGRGPADAGLRRGVHVPDPVRGPLRAAGQQREAGPG